MDFNVCFWIVNSCQSKASLFCSNPMYTKIACELEWILPRLLIMRRTCHTSIHVCFLPSVARTLESIIFFFPLLYLQTWEYWSSKAVNHVDSSVVLTFDFLLNCASHDSFYDFNWLKKESQVAHFPQTSLATNLAAPTWLLLQVCPPVFTDLQVQLPELLRAKGQCRKAVPAGVAFQIKDLHSFAGWMLKTIWKSVQATNM